MAHNKEEIRFRLGLTSKDFFDLVHSNDICSAGDKKILRVDRLNSRFLVKVDSGQVNKKSS